MLFISVMKILELLNHVIEINIEIDETSWQEMLDNPTSQEYTTSNITINGKLYNNVGIKPKGN